MEKCRKREKQVASDLTETDQKTIVDIFTSGYFCECISSLLGSDEKLILLQGNVMYSKGEQLKAQFKMDVHLWKAWYLMGLTQITGDIHCQQFKHCFEGK